MEKYRGKDSNEMRMVAKEVIEDIRIKAYAEGYERGRNDSAEGRSSGGDAEKTTLNTQQEDRDKIVEQAENDVKGLIAEAEGEIGATRYIPAVVESGDLTTVFLVERKERAVTALNFYKHVDEITEHRGSAKSSPSDCFNEHIGKAIALRRSLGLEVPNEYYNAPVPTEVRVGNVVNGNGTSDAYTTNDRFKVTEIDKTPIGIERFFFEGGEGDWIEFHQIGKIIDDSCGDR